MKYERMRKRMSRILEAYPESGMVSPEDLEEIIGELRDFIDDLESEIDVSTDTEEDDDLEEEYY